MGADNANMDFHANFPGFSPICEYINLNIDLMLGEVLLYVGRAHGVSRDYIAIGCLEEIMLYRRFDHSQSWFLENTVKSPLENWPHVLCSHVYLGGEGLEYLPTDSRRPDRRYPRRLLKSKQEMRVIWDELVKIRDILNKFNREEFLLITMSGDILDNLDEVKGVMRGMDVNLIKKHKSRELHILSVRAIHALSEMVSSVSRAQETWPHFEKWHNMMEDVLSSLRAAVGVVTAEDAEFAINSEICWTEE